MALALQKPFCSMKIMIPKSDHHLLYDGWAYKVAYQIKLFFLSPKK